MLVDYLQISLNLPLSPLSSPPFFSLFSFFQATLEKRRPFAFRVFFLALIKAQRIDLKSQSVWLARD
jgi:hypothetical protein